MQLEDLEAIQRAWDRLPGIAQDAYRDVRRTDSIDDYCQRTWRNVLWYIEQILFHTAPSDTALQSEAVRLQAKVTAILESGKRTHFRRLPIGSV